MDFFCAFHQKCSKMSMARVTIIYYINVKTKRTDFENLKLRFLSTEYRYQYDSKNLFFCTRRSLQCS